MTQEAYQAIRAEHEKARAIMQACNNAACLLPTAKNVKLSWLADDAYTAICGKLIDAALKRCATMTQERV